MIYVKSVIGGFAALLLSYVVFVLWGFTKLSPKPGAIGYTPHYIFSSRIFFIEIVIFLAGFLTVWSIMRQR